MKPFTEDTALQWAMRQCSLRECCRQELSRKMRSGGLAEDAIGRLLLRLQEENYLDEQRYARAFVHDKLAYNGWGRLKIREALKAKGVGREDIEQALAEIDGEEYEAILLRLLKAKAAAMPFDATDEQAAFKATSKLLRFAAARGFEYQLAAKAIRHLPDTTEPEEMPGYMD